MLAHKFTVEYPINNFTPEKLSNLRKIVKAKENLLKKALGANKLPVRTTKEMIRFPWFTLEDTSHAARYVQFVWTLCNMAKVRKRVNPMEHKPIKNPKLAMYRWLISIGMFGKEYKNAIKLLLKNFIENTGGQS